MGNIRCPVCDREFKGEPLKTWKYGIYKVKRFECSSCRAKFNLYENPKTLFTIPRSKRRRNRVTIHRSKWK